MYKSLIKSYVETLNKDAVKDFARKEGITLRENELNIIYNAIKKDTDILLSESYMQYIEKYKYDLSPEAYSKILELVNRYRKYLS